MPDLDKSDLGQSLIVTGGGRGIGAAVARLAAARGWAVTIGYHGNSKAADGLVADIVGKGCRAIAVRGDVSIPADVTRLFDHAEATHGKLRGLVNSAGILGPYGRLEDAATDGLARLLDINVLGTVLCCREAVRRMSTLHGGAGGAIVNLGSIAADLGSAGECVGYAASKGAVDSLTIGLAREVAREGIRVNAVRPGMIDTEMQVIPDVGNRLDMHQASIPIGRAGRADEAAEAVLWLLSGEASYVTGARINVSGGR